MSDFKTDLTKNKLLDTSEMDYKLFLTTHLVNSIMAVVGCNFGYCWGTVANGSYHGGEIPRHYFLQDGLV